MDDILKVGQYVKVLMRSRESGLRPYGAGEVVRVIDILGERTFTAYLKDGTIGLYDISQVSVLG